LLFVLWIWGRPIYRQLEERHWLAQSEKFFAREDYRNTALSLGKILRHNPSNLEACRRMAILADRCNLPATLDWFERVCDIQPSWTNRFNLAAVAVRLEPPPCRVAIRSLQALSDPNETQPAVQLLQARLALKLGQWESARHHFEAAARLEPQSLQHQLNLAVLDLHSTNLDCAAKARTQLEHLASAKSARATALRWLAIDSLGRHESAAALRYTAQLKAQPVADLEDRLLYLSALQMSGAGDFASQLHNVQIEAGQRAISLYAVSSWMLSHGLGRAALEWVTNCPVQVLEQPPACLAPVDCLGAEGDWLRLERYLDHQRHWGEWEFLRLAFLARAAFGQGQATAGQSRWRMAARAVDHQPGSQRALLKLATTWKDSWAEEELLWQIAQQFPSGRWAWPRLQQIYFATGNTRGLNRLSHWIASCLPDNAMAQNNAAATSLLLGQDLVHAHAMARRLYATAPSDPCLVSTYAYSLMLQGRAREGLSALEKLTPAAKTQSSVALYYGCLTAAVGDTNRAETWFQSVEVARLLPEERALLPPHFNRWLPRAEAGTDALPSSEQ